MNGFFKKPALIIILALGALFFLHVFIRYAKLSFTPSAQITPSSPVIERGAIVDRAGKPLAVQTNFYHVGITPRLVKNVDAFAADTAKILEMTEADLKRIITGADNSNFVYLKKNLTTTLPIGTTVSVFALRQFCKLFPPKINSLGLHWSLDKLNWRRFASISNRNDSEKISLKVKRGRFLIIINGYDWLTTFDTSSIL